MADVQPPTHKTASASNNHTAKWNLLILAIDFSLRGIFIARIFLLLYCIGVMLFSQALTLLCRPEITVTL